MADKTTTEQSVEGALTELREMFPDAPWITISGDYVNRLNGLGRDSTRISICGGEFFTAPTLYEAMSQVRERAAEQFRSRITLESGGQIK